MILRYRNHVDKFPLRMRKAKFTSAIEDFVLLDYTDQYLRLTW